VRQISNPLAGTDTTLLALAGVGAGADVRETSAGGPDDAAASGASMDAGAAGGPRAFGYMSCERALGASEGMNVLLERRRWRPAAAPGGGGGAGARARARAPLPPRFTAPCFSGFP